MSRVQDALADTRTGQLETREARRLASARRTRVRTFAVLGAVAMVAVLAVATALRVPALGANAPYTSYVDEHFPLEASARQIGRSTWDPGSYTYPSFLINATTTSALVLAAFHDDEARLGAGARATVASPFIEVVEPFDLVFAGRLVVLLLSLATVLLVGLLGARICSPPVGVLAASMVAVLPAFVTRGSIVTVDTAAACFATAALYCAARVSAARQDRQVLTWVVMGGAAAGLAFTSKYLSGSALFAVFAVVVLLRDRTIPRRLLLGVAACGGFLLSAVASMPAFVLDPSAVLAAMGKDMHVYGRASATSSYLYQLASRSELGVPVLLAGLIGLAVLLSARRARPVAIAYLAFALPTLAVLLQSSFQPARNVLPLLPFLTIAAAALLVDVVEAVGTSLRLPRAVSVAGAAVVVLVCCWPAYARTTKPFVTAQQTSVDTRVTARQWIERHVRRGERVLVAEELAFLPTELRRVCADVDVRSQRTAVAVRGYDWVVLGDLDRTRWTSPWVDELDALGARQPVFSVGSVPTSGADLRVPDQRLEDIWHRGRELIHVVRPSTAPPPLRRGPACRA